MGRPTAFVKVLQAPPRYPLVNPKKHLCPGIGYGEIAISDAEIVERV